MLKDKKAQPYKMINYTENGGMPQRYYAAMTPSPIWCYTQQLSQSLTWEAKQYGDSETRLFVFNNGIDIATYDAIEYKGKWYGVTRVDTTDDYNTDIYVYVSDMSTPNEDKIKPYGWTPENE